MKEYQIWEEEHNCEGNHNNYCIVIDKQNYIAQVENNSLTDIFIDDSELGWLYGTNILSDNYTNNKYKSIIEIIKNILKGELIID